jgi:ABC-type uncharacterized transport system permease subunit
MLAFPVEVLTGATGTLHEYALGFGTQILWLGLWLAAYHLVWTRGVRRYEGAGA